MSITGAPDEDGGGPTKVGVAISDVVTGLNGAVAILAALARRDGIGRRPQRGQRIDLSLLGSTLAALVNQAQNAFVGGVAPGRLGNAHPNIVPYETFDTADGEIAVAVGSERQWPRFCRALGLPALADDPRFATNGERVANRARAASPTLARAPRRADHRGLARRPRRGRCPGRADQRCRRGVRLAVGAAARRPSSSTIRSLVGPARSAPPFDLSATPASVPHRRRRSSASTPTRSSRELGYDRSRGRRPAGRRGSSERRSPSDLQSSWRRNASHATTTVTPMRATAAIAGPRTSTPAWPSASPRAVAPSPAGR